MEGDAMKQAELTKIGIGLLLLAGLTTAGCGLRDARSPSPDAADTPNTLKTESPEPLIEPAPETTLPPSPEPTAAAVTAQAAELELAEAELIERMQELDRKMFELEARELESNREQDSVELTDFEPNEMPEAEAIPVVMLVSQGTPLEIEFMDALSSELSEIGNSVRARVVTDVGGESGDAIPAGTTLWGQVTDVRSERKIASTARLELTFEEMELPTGQLVPIESTLLLEGAKQKKKDAATIGGSAAGGAILGRAMSNKRKKGKGTVIGAILGAAVGAAAAKENKGDPVVVEPGQNALLQLGAPAEWTMNSRELELVARNR